LVEAELSLALRRPGDADTYRHSLERIARETAHMRRLVDDLLWLARFDSRAGEELPGSVDLVEAAARSVERFDGIAARRSQDLSLSVPGTAPPTVMAPEAWISRLLAVIIDNACRYTPEGGSIVVAVGQVEERPWITIEDSGPGVPPDDRQRIFDRFHRATSVPGGSGLGLAIADAIVQATGGRWRVDEAFLGGARFMVSWPPPRGTLRPDAVQIWRGGANQ
jgi:signal transduction histidine kinase